MAEFRRQRRFHGPIVFGGEPEEPVAGDFDRLQALLIRRVAEGVAVGEGGSGLISWIGVVRSSSISSWAIDEPHLQSDHLPSAGNANLGTEFKGSLAASFHLVENAVHLSSVSSNFV